MEPVRKHRASVMPEGSIIETSQGAFISAKIDWLAVTTKEPPTFPDGTSQNHKECVPAQGYNVAREYIPDGRRVSWHSLRPEMLYHTIYTGSTLNRLQEDYEVQAMKILVNHLETDNAKVSRLDVAIDLYATGVKIANLRELVKEGKCQTKARKHSYTVGNGGETLYIGSRQSQRFLRIYDKAAEQGVGGDWLRVELELKAAAAAAAAEIIATDDKPMERVRNMVLGFAHFPNDEKWVKAFKGAVRETPKAKQTDSDTEGWLLTQCAPALAKHAATRDPAILDRFADVLEAEFRRMKSEIHSGAIG